MKYTYLLLAFALVFVTGCGDDDEGGGTGGQDGDLVIRLTWDQADADLDLAMTGPNSLLIGGGDPRHSGDDLDGPGEETITFDNDAADGTYVIFTSWFSGAGDVPYTLRIESANSGQTFNETINEAVDLDQITVIKNGGNLTF